MNIGNLIFLKDCIICGAPSDGLHFGIQCCRACAAFFRRTTRLKIKYTCKKKGNCGIAKGTRVMCRSCRYKKCLSLGMLTKNVCEPFDSIGKREPGSCSDNTTTMLPEHPDTQSRESSNSSSVQELGCCKPKRKAKDSKLQSSPLSEPTILDSMVNGYHNFLYLRKASDLICKKNNASTEESCGQACSSTSTYENSQKQCMIELSLLKDILTNFYHPLSKLKGDEQKILIEKFHTRFSNIERAYSTYKKFGNLENNQNLIMPDGESININDDLSKYYRNCKNSNPQEVAKVFYPAMFFVVNDIVPFLSKIQMDESELCALFGIILWQERDHTLSKEIINICHEARNEIFKALSFYYQSKNLSLAEMSIKIGNLMLVITKIEHSITLTRENREVAELFNMIEFDQCCRA